MVQFALSDSKMCLSFLETKKYSPGTTPSPWNLGSNWTTPSKNSEFWHVLPCSASMVRDRKRSSITVNKKSTRAFQRDTNQGSTPPLTSSKWGSNTKMCRLSDNFDNKGREVCCKVSLYKNYQRQSCSAINCLSSGVNILAGGIAPDRRTDRQKDIQTDGIAIASTALAMRALRRAVIIIIIIIRKFITRTCSQALSMNRRRLSVAWKWRLKLYKDEQFLMEIGMEFHVAGEL